MKKISIVSIAIMVIGLAACDSFFSNSWGSPRKYDAANINITAANMDTYLDMAVGNPDFSRAAGKATVNKMKNSSTADQAKLMEAAVEFAWIGSELDTFILSQAGDLADRLLDGDDNFDDEEIVQTFVDALGSLFSNPGFGEAVDNLADSAANLITLTGGNTPTFNPGYKPDAAEVDKAVLTLLAGMVNENGILDSTSASWEKVGDILQGFTVSGSPKKIIVLSGTPDPAPLALAAYFNLIATPGSYTGDSLIAKSIYEAMKN